MKKAFVKNCPAPDLILIDLDGTLYPEDTLYKAAVHKAVRKTIWQNPSSLFNGLADKLSDYSAQHGLHDAHPPQEIGRLVDTARAQFKPDFVRPSTALSHMAAALSDRLVVFSNSPQSCINDVLQRLELDRIIPEGQRYSAPRHIGFGKHMALTYEKALRRIAPGLAPHQAMLIDNSSANLLAARTAGLQTVLVSPHGEGRNPSYHVMHTSPNAASALAWVASLRPAR